MQPAVVFPLHDPQGAMLPHLDIILSSLKSIFSHAYVGITAVTCVRCKVDVETLEKDDFFTILKLPPDMPIGDQWTYLYRQTANLANLDQVLHLCFVDRLAFILQSSHRERFIEDMRLSESQDIPIIYSRSAVAWETHPRNYREIETFATTVGECLFGRSLDFTWCHLAMRASQLREIISHVTQTDMSIQAEMVLEIRDAVIMQEVDWLEWEDPFLIAVPGKDLKNQLEHSAEETKKRLSYVLPTIETLVRHNSM